MMLIVDTNVISELMRNTVAAPVAAYFARQASVPLWTTTVSYFEVQYGILSMPPGKRRRTLQASFEEWAEIAVQRRVLPFDVDAAGTTAELAANMRGRGRQVEIRDLQIAGIVATHGATLVTRNERDFAGTGIQLVNPWHA